MKIKRNYFLLLALICLSVSTLARASKPITGTKKIAIAGTFKKITITGRVKVVLVDNAADSFTISGEENNVQAIKMDIRNGKLRIKAPHKTIAEKSVVYVPVSIVNDIAIDGDSDVYSDVILTAPVLSLSVSGAAHARLKTTGEVEVSTGDDYEIIYLKQEAVHNNSGNNKAILK